MTRSGGIITVTDHQVVSSYTVMPEGVIESQSCVLISPTFFGRIAYLAQMYDLVRLESLSIRFVPMYGTSVPGMLSMYFDYNDSVTMTNIPLAQSLLASGVVSGPVYRPLTLVWHSQDHGDVEFGSSTSNTTFRSDNKLTGFHFAMSLPAVNPGNYGLLVCDYRVSLKSLKSSAAGVSNSQSDALLVSKVPSAQADIFSGHMSDTIQNLPAPK